ncbi:kyphoscoliosis peptidase-like [Branchiostoma floridae x Branchiostoma japonicum]
MGCSCSKSRRVVVPVEEQRPVRKFSVRDGKQPTPHQHRQLEADNTLEQNINRPDHGSLQDSVAKIQQTGGEEHSEEQVEGTVPQETTDVTVVGQKKDETTQNDEQKDTVTELQETIGEHGDQAQAEVPEDSMETADATAVEQKKEQTSFKNEDDKSTVAELEVNQAQAEVHEDQSTEKTDVTAVEQNEEQASLNREDDKDTVTELQETIGERGDQAQAEVPEDSMETADATAVEQSEEQTSLNSEDDESTVAELRENQAQAEFHEDSTEKTDVMTVEQNEEQTSLNNEHDKDTVEELQETIGEENDQRRAEVSEDSTPMDCSVQNIEESLEQKTPEPITKKDLIPDVEVFKDLDERAIQAPEGHATIKDLVLYLIETATTPLEKARVLFRWVTSHIQYDVVSYVTGGPKEVTPEGVFKKRMSVCQGYADLYKDMCRLADVNCVTISGRSKGGSYRVGRKFGPGSDHAWNAVEIDGRWYLLDCTWAAGNTDLQKRTFEFKYNEHYFFTDPEVFVMDHHPMDNKWQLLEEPVSLEVFENQVLLKSPFFSLGLLPKFLSHTMSPVCTQNGNATISIKFPEPMAFSYHLYPAEGGYAQDENVLHEIVDNVALFKVVPAQKGKFMLQIYGKFNTATGQYSEICSYMIDSAGPMADQLPFPRLKTSTWGPGPWLLNGFISDVSHPRAIVTLPEGEAKIELNSVKPLQYMCNIKEGDRKWDNYAFSQVSGQTASIYVRAPRTGQFILTIWAKEEYDQTYSKSVYYLLRCTKCKTTISPYPQTFGNWTNGCRLYEPLDGRLAANRRVHFRVVCPNAVEVVVIAIGKWHKLARNADDSWEGDADTGEQSKILQVSAKKPGDTQYWTVLQYEVVA